jgi:hypothetical protein
VPKSRGGSNRVSNLTLACPACNSHKGNQTAEEFGYPDDIQRHARQPLGDAAAVNVTRRVLWERLKTFGLPLEVGTGGRTKFNRSHQHYPKAHWIDAACVGRSGEHVHIDPELTPLIIKATGRQSRLMCRPDKYGFPRTRAKQGRVQFGFQTGDMVNAIVTSGRKVGIYRGRVVVRRSGSFNITTATDTVQGISHRYCRVLHQADGYSYLKGAAHSSYSTRL